MDYPKSTPNVGLLNGKFVDENTSTGVVGSLIPSSWGNSVTDELLNVIRAGGEEPVEDQNDQLLAAIQVIVQGYIPSEQVRTTLAEYGITDAYTKAQTYSRSEVAEYVSEQAYSKVQTYAKSEIEALTAQATEAKQGTAKVASDTQMLEGTSDAVMLTPKKARKGFAISLAENGYIAFPTWLGGLILQWGAVPAAAADTVVALSFPLAFPGSCLGGLSVGNRATPVSGGTSSWYFASPTKNGATLVHDGSNGGTMGAYWFSWGN
jgi:hypothetical protein